MLINGDGPTGRHIRSRLCDLIFDDISRTASLFARPSAELHRDISLPDHTVQQLILDSLSSRRTVHETVDRIISTAATASLAGYRRDEPWRIEVLPAGSADAASINSRLDRLRADLIPLAGCIAKIISERRVKPSMRRALSLLILALDAAPQPMIATFSMSCGISPNSHDPQGDAQYEAECQERDG